MGTHCPRWASDAQRVDETSQGSLLVLDEPAALPTRSTNAVRILGGIRFANKEADMERSHPLRSRVEYVGPPSPVVIAKIDAVDFIATRGR